MSEQRYKDTANYARDILGKDGRQIVFPWSAGRTISTRQAAERMGVCETVVREQYEEGKIQGYPITDKKGSPIRIVSDSVDLWLERKLAKHDTGDAELHRRLNSRGPHAPHVTQAVKHVKR